jgi:cell division transport system ATP-binding protein
MSVIEYRNVDIQIDSKIILENVTFALEEGEFAYVVGTVGSGKSTLLKTIYGEVDIEGGEALVFDKYDLTDISNRKLQELRRKIGIVFQDFQLLTDRSVHDNLDFVLRCTWWKDKEARETRIEEVLEQVGLLQKGYKRPHELSGGEQQRVVIARAILNKPELILADEPTGNLDVETGRHIVKLLKDICSQGSAILMITHNLNMLTEYPGKVYRFADHHIEEVTAQFE